MSFLRNNACYIFIAMWMMYYLQELLMITGIIAQSILVLLMLMSFYAFFQVNIHYRIGPYFKWLNGLLLVITLYGLILFFSGFALYPDEFNLNTSLEFGYLQRIYTSVLPIYAFYFFTLQGDFNEKNMKFLFMAFLLFSIIMYNQNFFLVSGEIEKEEITNNMGYVFVPLIPMLGLFKMKDLWKYIFLIIIYAYIMMAMKRGAILVGTIALFLYMKRHLRARTTEQIIYILFLSVAAICLIYLFVMNLYETSDYFKIRVNSTLEGDTSTRSWMYPFYFDYFIHRTSGWEFLFGCGANATYLRLGNNAHNDWLEFAINQGVFGVILYLFYWVFYVREWNSYCGPIEFKQTLGDFIIIYFLVSLFSMSIDGMPTVTALCVGYCLAQNEKAKRKIILKTGQTFIYK